MGGLRRLSDIYDIWCPVSVYASMLEIYESHLLSWKEEPCYTAPDYADFIVLAWYDITEQVLCGGRTMWRSQEHR